MHASPWLIPIDLETYLAYHFTKVGDQTRAHLEHWIESGNSAGLSTSALSRLREGMDHDIARNGAAVVGTINGSLELMQLGMLLRTLPGGKQLLRGVSRKMTQKALTSPSMMRALAWYCSW